MLYGSEINHCLGYRDRDLKQRWEKLISQLWVEAHSWRISPRFWHITIPNTECGWSFPTKSVYFFFWRGDKWTRKEARSTACVGINYQPKPCTTFGQITQRITIKIHLHHCSYHHHHQPPLATSKFYQCRPFPRCLFTPRYPMDIKRQRRRKIIEPTNNLSPLAA